MSEGYDETSLNQNTEPDLPEPVQYPQNQHYPNDIPDSPPRASIETPRHSGYYPQTLPIYQPPQNYPNQYLPNSQPYSEWIKYLSEQQEWHAESSTFNEEQLGDTLHETDNWRKKEREEEKKKKKVGKTIIRKCNEISRIMKKFIKKI